MSRLSIRFWGIWGLSLWIVPIIAVVAVVAVWLLPTRYNPQIESSALVLAAILIGWSALQSRSLAYSTRDQIDVSSKMAQETQEARFASLQPIIVMGRTIAYGVIRDVRQIAEQPTIDERTFLYNVGSGPALNLQFYLKEPDRKNPSAIFSGRQLMALSPEEGYDLSLSGVFGQQWLRTQDLVVEYEDVFGRKWCSGLELNHTEGRKDVTVMKLFYEKLD